MEVIGVTTLVTGATGFIGANVVRVLLDAGASVNLLLGLEPLREDARVEPLGDDDIPF